MNVSTTGALSVAAGEALVPFTGAERLGALVSLVLLVGAFQVAFGLLGFGRLIRFVSNAVMTGFITGIAFLIMFGPVSDITGYSSFQPNHLLRLAGTVLNWRQLDLHTIVLVVAAIVLIFAFQRTAAGKFSLIIALAGAAGLAYALTQMAAGGTVVPVGDVAVIPRSLPFPIMANLARIPETLLPAFAIAVIGLIQVAGVPQPGRQVSRYVAGPRRSGRGQHRCRRFRLDPLRRGAVVPVANPSDVEPRRGAGTRTCRRRLTDRKTGTTGTGQRRGARAAHPRLAFPRLGAGARAAASFGRIGPGHDAYPDPARR
jgi:SulP family sulfate permease